MDAKVSQIFAFSFIHYIHILYILDSIMYFYMTSSHVFQVPAAFVIYKHHYKYNARFCIYARE